MTNITNVLHNMSIKRLNKLIESFSVFVELERENNPHLVTNLEERLDF